MISSNLFSLKYGNNPALISDEYVVTYSDIVIQIDEMVNVYILLQKALLMQIVYLNKM